MGIDKDVVFAKRKDGLLELDILAISDWDGFSKIIRFLEKDYHAEVVNFFDGIWSRECKLKVKTVFIKLVYYDFSNTLEATSVEANQVVEVIGKDLEQRFARYA